MELRDRLDTMVHLHQANAKYCEYLLNKTEISLTREDYQSLYVLYSALNFVNCKEGILERDGINSYTSKIYEEQLEEQLQKLVKMSDDKYLLGSISFNNTADIFVFIRNKIAHGDYVINYKNNSISFERDNDSGEISIPVICSFSMILNNFTNDLTISNSYIYSLCKYSDSEKSIIIHDLDSFGSCLGNILYDEICVERKDKGDLTYQEKSSVFSLFYFLSQDLDDGFSFENDKNISSYFDRTDLCCKRESCPISEVVDIKLLYSRYINEGNSFNSLSPAGQLSCLKRWVQQAKGEQFVTPVSGIAAVVDSLLQSTPNDKGNTYHLNSVDNDFSKIVYKEKIVASYLAQFYVMYQYGMDILYKYGDGINYANLEFDLKSFLSNGMNCSTFNELGIRIDSLKQKIDIINQRLTKEIKSKEKVLKKREDSGKVLEYEKPLSIISNKITAMEDRVMELKIELLGNVLQRQVILDDPLHYINQTTIDHVRNSLAHGGVTFNLFVEASFCGSIPLHIKDIYNGISTYDTVVSLESFCTMFQEKNIQVVSNYLTQVSRGEIVSASSLEKRYTHNY